MDSLPAALAPWSKVLVVLVIVLVVKVLLDLFMNTKAGFLLRAEGDNARRGGHAGARRGAGEDRGA